MNSFKAWWTCRLEMGGKISAEEVWKEALNHLLRKFDYSSNWGEVSAYIVEETGME